jgi:2-polyprenyl-6-methoxyphenol hydroxylase-like FAD-dependent oxidoreductase
LNATVLVVGAGPVGLTMAIELTRYGVGVRIVDKLSQRSNKSKALAVWARTLELMDRAGVSDALVEAGLKANGARMFADGRQLGDLAFNDLPSAHPYVLLITQDETERVLEEHLAALGVMVERDVEMTGFTDDGSRVASRLTHRDGSIEEPRTDWLVGCDGAHSSIRHTLGKSFDGKTVPTDFILADVYLSGSAEISRTQISMFAHADGLLMLFPIRGDRYRVIADLGEARGAPPIDPTLTDVQAVIDHRGVTGIVAHDPIWLSAFRINERLVEDYRSGRVFLAGDAAHVHSPAGGQGMNTGMQDACNLAWKLALACAGTCSDELLSTYSSERRGIAREMIAETGKLTATMTTKNPLLQAVRNTALHLLLGLPAVRGALAARLSEIEIGYPDSPLSRESASPLPKPHAGERATLARSERPSARSAPRYALFAEATDAARHFVSEWASIVESQVEEPFAPGTAWLVRPDGYVGTAADGDWNALHAYLQGIVRSTV